MTPPTVEVSKDAILKLVSSSQFSPNFCFIDDHITKIINTKQLLEQCKNISKIVEVAKAEQFSDIRPFLVDFLWSLLLDCDTVSSTNLDLQTNFFKLVVSAILTLQDDKINDLFGFEEETESINQSIKMGFIMSLVIEKLLMVKPDIVISKLSTILKMFAKYVRIVSNAALSKENNDFNNNLLLSRDSFKLQNYLTKFLQSSLIKTVPLQRSEVYATITEIELTLINCNNNNEDIFWSGIKGVIKIHSFLLSKILNNNEIEDYLANSISPVSLIFKIENAPSYIQIAILVSMLEFIVMNNNQLIDTLLENIIIHLEKQITNNSQNFRQLCLYICIEVNILLKISKQYLTRATQIALFMIRETPISEDKACVDLFTTIITSLNSTNNDKQHSIKAILNSIYMTKKMKVKIGLLNCLILADIRYFEDYLIVDSLLLVHLFNSIISDNDNDTELYLKLLSNILDKSSIDMVYPIRTIINDVTTTPSGNLKNIVRCAPIFVRKGQHQLLSLIEMFLSQASYEITKRYQIALFSLLQYCKSKGMLDLNFRVTLSNDKYVDVDYNIFKRGLAHIAEEVGITSLHLLVSPVVSNEWILYEMDVIKTILPIRIEYCLLNNSFHTLAELAHLVLQFNEKLIAYKFTEFEKFEEYCKWFCNFSIDLFCQQRTSDSKALGLKILSNMLSSVYKYSKHNPNCVCILNHTLSKEIHFELLKLIVERFEYIRADAFSLLLKYYQNIIDKETAVSVFNQGRDLVRSNWTPHSDAGARLLVLLASSPLEIQLDLFKETNLFLYIVHCLEQNYICALEDVKNIVTNPFHGGITALRYCIENIENGCHFTSLFPLLQNIYEIIFKQLRYIPNVNTNINYEDNQFIISCWNTIKELCSLFVILAKKLPTSYIGIMGEMFLDIFLHTKHNGVLETGFQYYRIFCNKLETIPTPWMELFLQKIVTDQTIFLSTSPISGPAYWFISTISNMLEDYKLYVHQVIKIASQQENEGAQIISINILHAIAKDSLIGHQFAPFFEQSLILVCNNINSLNWEVRSVSLMLYGTLASKLKNQMLTFQKFSKKYPLVSKHFRLEIESLTDREEYMYAILGIWSTLTASKIEQTTDVSLISLLQDIGNKSKSFYMRQAVSNTILTILPISEYNNLLYNLCSSLPDKYLQITSNKLHFVLQLILKLSDVVVKNTVIDERISQCIDSKLNYMLLMPNIHPVCKSLLLKYMLRHVSDTNLKYIQTIKNLLYNKKTTMIQEDVAKYCYLWLLKSDCNENNLLVLLETASLECRRRLLKEYYKKIKIQFIIFSDEGILALTALLLQESDVICKIYELKLLRKLYHNTNLTTTTSSQIFNVAISKLSNEAHHEVIFQSLMLLTLILPFTTQFEIWLRIIKDFSSNDNVQLRLAAAKSVKLFLLSNPIHQLDGVVLNLCMDTDMSIRDEMYHCLHEYYPNTIEHIMSSYLADMSQKIGKFKLQELISALKTNINKKSNVDFDPSRIVDICNLFQNK